MVLQAVHILKLVVTQVARKLALRECFQLSVVAPSSLAKLSPFHQGRVASTVQC